MALFSWQANGFLFPWLIAFHFFDKAVSGVMKDGRIARSELTVIVKQSFKLKNAYIEQLRNLSLVGGSLLPALFSILGVSERGRPFDLSPYSVDEFHLEREPKTF
jgi:hypothetical protein